MQQQMYYLQITFFLLYYFPGIYSQKYGPVVLTTFDICSELFCMWNVISIEYLFCKSR